MDNIRQMEEYCLCLTRCDETAELWLLNVLLQHGIGMSSLIGNLSCENNT